MKIKHREYTIENDGNLQIILYKNKIVKTGKNAGKTRREIIGYYPSLKGLLSRLVNISAFESDIKTLEELMKCMQRIEKNIDKTAVACVEATKTT